MRSLSLSSPVGPPTITPDDATVIGRLRDSSSAFDAARDLADAKTVWSIAHSGIGRAEDREDARQRADERVRHAQDNLTATSRAAGFGSPEDYQRTADAFVRFFERFACGIALKETNDQEAIVRAELGRYRVDGSGSHLPELHKALDPARGKLAQYDEYLRYLNRAASMDSWHVPTKEETRERERVRSAAEPLMGEIRQILRSLAGAFPILLDPDLTRDDVNLRKLLEAEPDQLYMQVAETATARLRDIRHVRAELSKEPELVWQLQPLISRAMKHLAVPSGSVYDKLIRHKQSAIADNASFKKLALGALGIGFGLLTGGTGWVAFAGSLGAAGTSGYLLNEDVREYMLQSAAAGSALDRAQALASDDPSLVWLAVSIVGTALDFASVFEAFSRLRGPARAALKGAEDLAKFQKETEDVLRRLGHPNPEAAAEEIASEARRSAAGTRADATRVREPLPAGAKASAGLKTWTPEELARFEKHVLGFAGWEGMAGRTSKPMYIVRVGERGAGKGGGMWGAALFEDEQQARRFAEWLAAHPKEELRQWFAIPHAWVGGDVSKFQAVKVFEVPTGTAILKGPVAPQLEGAARYGEVSAGMSAEQMLEAGKRARTVAGGGPQVAVDPAVRVKPTNFEIPLDSPPVASAAGGHANPAHAGPATGLAADAEWRRYDDFRRKPRAVLEADPDPMAKQVLSDYDAKSVDELIRMERDGDSLAREVLDQRLGGKRRPFAPGRPSRPDIQSHLREELIRFREEVEAGRHEPLRADPADWTKTKKPAGAQEPVQIVPTSKEVRRYRGTVGVAESDIPALEGRTFHGASPEAGGNLQSSGRIKPSEELAKVPQAHRHAEQDLANQIDKALQDLSPAEYELARGHTVFLRIDQEVCSTCAAGLGGGTREGVLAQLSKLHPDVVFEITADDVSTVIRLKNGRRVP